MSLTPHQAKYYAHDLTRRAVAGMDRLSMALFDAAVDLNPHHIETSLFALLSPLSKGVVLADEVCLIYVNGGNNLENRKTPEDLWKVPLIEEDLHRLMFEMEGA